ncbi:MAG TPA: thiamine phosphate synthase [Pseudolabrys sp.]|nr:thiamine phosphate synthase [Pseudolabrys sp.]
MASRPRDPAPRPAPRLYLMTPPIANASTFSAQLASALDAGDIAAVLLRLAASDERTLINRVKALAPSVQDKGAALLLDGAVRLVARSGADGAHLSGIADFTAALETLKPERIAGVGGLVSRHDAMLAAEQGADYVMFGEPDPTGKCPAFAAVEERVAWWAEVFEIACVAYAASIDSVTPLVSAGADFIAIGDVIWGDPRLVAETVSEASRLLRLADPVT